MRIDVRSGHGLVRGLRSAGPLPLLLVLGACAAGMRSEGATIGAVTAPTYHVGDSLTYEENGEEDTIFVTAVDGDQVSWTDNKGARWTGFPDPVIPPRLEAAGPAGEPLLRFFAPAQPTIFPLEPGKRIHYSVTLSRAGQPAPSSEQQSCEVHAPRPITVEAGTYRAWEILCQRSGYRETLYYAPAIGAIVLKRRDSEAMVRLQTLADYHKAEPGPASPDQGSAATAAGAPPDGLPAESPTATAAAGPAAGPTARAQRPPLAPALQEIIPDPFSAAPLPAAAPVAPSLAAPRPTSSPRPASAQASRSSAPDSSPGGARYVVQLAAYRSSEAADQSWHGIARRLPQLLHDVNPQFEDITAHGARFVRLLVGPFESEAAARQLCGQLRTAGQDCWVRPTP